MKSNLLILLTSLFLSSNLLGKTIKGIVYDHLNEPLFGATILVKGSTNAVQSDFEGKFSLTVSKEEENSLLEIMFIGYASQSYEIQSIKSELNIQLKQDSKLLKEVKILNTGVTEEVMKEPITIETMDLASIKENPSGDFYEGLGNMKGVDMTKASLGFTIVNTRGFNSTSPVRTLQLIDGVDNAAPGLGFSLGNFLGSSELDIQKVELIVGANSSLYGPNAFNGVINMTTKDPFTYRGLSAKIRSGERNLVETAIRYANVIDQKERWAFKINLSILRADDWIADNRDSTQQSTVDPNNLGGYDAVNTYGDELFISASNSFSPGLGTIHRTGYQEKDLVDYNTENLKFNGLISHKLNNDSRLDIAYNLGYGTTVYQAYNRISLKDILFQQQRIEWSKKDEFFIRAYMTHEDAGNSYDAVLAANQMLDYAKPIGDWNNDYLTYWNGNIKSKIQSIEGWPQVSFGVPFDEEAADSILALTWVQDSLAIWHDQAQTFANGIGNPLRGNLEMFQPGTASYDSLLTSVITNSNVQTGGAQLYDKSKLIHLQAQKEWHTIFGKLRTGANVRKYLPVSNGRLFSDTNGVKINSWEYGTYLHLEKEWLANKMTSSASIRMDKNNNINQYLFSPSVTSVYELNENNTLRASLGSATRNPTLGDQFLYYNMGSAIILGNISGYDSLVTIPSLIDFLESNLTDYSALEYFNAPPIVPEQVKTIELGYKAVLLKKKIFFDCSYYYSWYKNFIGYKVGATQPKPEAPSVFDIYRITVNSQEQVTTQGLSIGINSFIFKQVKLDGNYSFNKLNQTAEKDPIIPAFNTPKHKFNIGLSCHDLNSKIGFLKFNEWGFSIKYKWVEGFQYEGSPQFTGYVPQYSSIDAQCNTKIKLIRSTVKVGVSNLLNQKYFSVIGSPYVGRMAYISLNFDLNNGKVNLYE